MMKRKLTEALETTREFEHPEVLISVTNFLTLGKLQSHEELRDRGLLLFHDQLGEISRAPQRVMFFSHQWTSWTEPDPTNQQYECMVAAALTISKTNGWPMERVWVWCDYISIPQRTRNTQKLAINSLASYASIADAFVIVAPTVIHNNTGLECNVATYNKRMWCRAENLCHSLRNGIHDMWVVTSTDSVAKLKDDAEFMQSNLRVMQGDSTREDDKLTLVLPILGLYAELFACTLHVAELEKQRNERLEELQREDRERQQREEAQKHESMRHSKERHGSIQSAHGGQSRFGSMLCSTHGEGRLTSILNLGRFEGRHDSKATMRHSSVTGSPHGTGSCANSFTRPHTESTHAIPNLDSRATMRRSSVTGSPHGTGSCANSFTQPHTESTHAIPSLAHVLSAAGADTRHAISHVGGSMKQIPTMAHAINNVVSRGTQSIAKLRQSHAAPMLDKARRRDSWTDLLRVARHDFSHQFKGHGVVSMINEARDEIFPKDINLTETNLIVAEPSLSVRPKRSSKNGESSTRGSRARTRRMTLRRQQTTSFATRLVPTSRTVELFGPLVDMMEKLVTEDGGVRNKLVKQVIQRMENNNAHASAAAARFAKVWRRKAISRRHAASDAPSPAASPLGYRRVSPRPSERMSVDSRLSQQRSSRESELSERLSPRESERLSQRLSPLASKRVSQRALARITSADEVEEDALDAAAAAAETDGGTEADVVPDTTTAPSVQDDDELPSEQVHAEANGALANGAPANGEGLSSATTPPPKGWVLLRESRARGLWV